MGTTATGTRRPETIYREQSEIRERIHHESLARLPAFLGLVAGDVE